MSDRASRLREQRNRSKEAVRSQASENNEKEEPSEPSNTPKPSKPSQTSQTEEPEQPSEPEETSEDEDDDEQSVKDEQVGTYLYLPEGQRDEMKYQYKMLSAEYEREFGEELEKNRHFYPLVVEYGLDRLADLDAQDVRDLLDELDY